MPTAEGALTDEPRSSAAAQTARAQPAESGTARPAHEASSTTDPHGASQLVAGLNTTKFYSQRSLAESGASLTYRSWPGWYNPLADIGRLQSTAARPSVLHSSAERQVTGGAASALLQLSQARAPGAAQVADTSRTSANPMQLASKALHAGTRTHSQVADAPAAISPGESPADATVALQPVEAQPSLGGAQLSMYPAAAVVLHANPAQVETDAAEAQALPQAPQSSTQYATAAASGHRRSPSAAQLSTQANPRAGVALLPQQGGSMTSSAPAPQSQPLQPQAPLASARLSGGAHLSVPNDLMRGGSGADAAQAIQQPAGGDTPLLADATGTGHPCVASTTQQLELHVPQLHTSACCSSAQQVLEHALCSAALSRSMAPL